MAARGHLSASSQSLRFILSLRLYSRFITSRSGPGYQWESNKLTVRHHKREPRGQPFRNQVLGHSGFLLDSMVSCLVQQLECWSVDMLILRPNASCLTNQFYLLFGSLDSFFGDHQAGFYIRVHNKALIFFFSTKTYVLNSVLPPKIYVKTDG